jgi:hypothetical protein
MSDIPFGTTDWAGDDAQPHRSRSDLGATPFIVD